MAGEQARLFLALWPPADVRQAVLRWAEAGQWPSGARRTAPSNLHLTLHFIGMVPTARLPDIVPALAVDAERFTLDFGHAQAWPRGLQVLVPNAEPNAVPPAAGALHARLAQALHGLRLRVEDRPWRPHVTLAREAPGAVLPPAPALRWAAEGYALVQSERGYTTLARYPLR